jgi:hypothetical protein
VPPTIPRRRQIHHQPPSAVSAPEPAAGEEEEAEQTAAAAFTLDADPSNRIWDRLLAAFGFLDDVTKSRGGRGFLEC